MGAFTKIVKYAAGQVIMSTVATAARRVGTEAGDEIGKVAAKKSVEQIKKHVLKEEPTIEAQPKPQIRTGNPKLDILANVLVDQARKNIGTTEQKPTPTTNDISEAAADNTIENIKETASVVGSVVAEKTEKTVNVAKQIHEGFMKGLKKGK